MERYPPTCLLGFDLGSIVVNKLVRMYATLPSIPDPRGVMDIRADADQVATQFVSQHACMVDLPYGDSEGVPYDPDFRPLRFVRHYDDNQFSCSENNWSE